MTTPPTPPTDNLAAESGPRSEMSEPKIMTVCELVAELAMGPVESFDKPVALEGCDCWGDLWRVAHEGERVLLVRTDSHDYDPEEFCPRCLAGTESSEHFEKCGSDAGPSGGHA